MGQVAPRPHPGAGRAPLRARRPKLDGHSGRNDRTVPQSPSPTPYMVESIAELRRRVQAPVRHNNDIAGVLVGDWASILVTRLFIGLRLSPTLATWGMLVSGTAGSLLVATGDRLAPLGFFLVFLYYISDCVDGEVARYWKIEKLIWGFHEFFFHLYVKGAFFLCLGWAVVESTGSRWAWLLAFAALLATFCHKALRDLPSAMAGRALLGSARESRWLAAHLEADPDHLERETEDQPSADPALPSFGSRLAVARAILTNFDLSTIFFLLAALADLALEPALLGGVPWDCKALLLAFYGVVLPLHYADTYRTWVRQDRFLGGSRRLLERAHRFRIETAERGAERDHKSQ